MLWNRGIFPRGLSHTHIETHNDLTYIYLATVDGDLPVIGWGIDEHDNLTTAPLAQDKAGFRMMAREGMS